MSLSSEDLSPCLSLGLHADLDQVSLVDADSQSWGSLELLLPPEKLLWSVWEEDGGAS